MRRKLRRRFGGWQFNISYQEDKVVKTPKSWFQTVLTVLPQKPFLILNQDFMREIERVRSETRYSLKGIQERNIDRSMLANLSFEDDKIIQDRVDLVIDVLEEKNIRDQQKIIDDYFDFVHGTWRQGFHERTYNFTINHGYNIGDELVLIAVGELTFDKETVLSQLKNRKWEDQFSYSKHLSKELKNYFDEKAAEYLTEQKLDEHWKRSFIK